MGSTIRWSPHRELEVFQNRLNRIFNDVRHAHATRSRLCLRTGRRLLTFRRQTRSTL
jgi:hypothetical protein